MEPSRLFGLTGKLLCGLTFLFREFVDPFSGSAMYPRFLFSRRNPDNV